MTSHVIIPEMNLSNIIAEAREVSQALNEFADNLERIERKYANVSDEMSEQERWRRGL